MKDVQRVIPAPHVAPITNKEQRLAAKSKATSGAAKLKATAPPPVLATTVTTGSNVSADVQNVDSVHPALPEFAIAFQKQLSALQADNVELKSSNLELKSSNLELTSRVSKIESLQEENQRLKQEIVDLKAALLAATTTTAAPTEATSSMDVDVSRDLSVYASKYAEVASKSPAPSAKVVNYGKAPSAPRRPAGHKQVVKRPAPPPSEKKVEASARLFRAPEGPQGYEYVFLTRARSLTRAEIRRNLARLGLDCGRILDITFPARSVLGLLVHLQYKPVVLEALDKVKISVLTFDPLDPKHLGDPKITEGKSDDERVAAAKAIHASRCLRTISHVRSSVAAGVARSFVSLGWLSSEEARQAATGSGSSLVREIRKDFGHVDDDESMKSASPSPSVSTKDTDAPSQESSN